MARSAKARKAKKKSGGVTLDFEGVESGGRTIEDGWAHGRIKEAELTESSNGNEMFNIKWDAQRGKEKATVFDHVVLTPNALWKMRNLLEACGVEVPEGEMEVTEDMLVDLECDIEITNEEFEGKERPRVTAYRGESEEDDSDDEEEEEEEDDDTDDEEEDEDDEEDEAPPKRKKKPAKKSKDEDDDEEEEDEDDEESDDDDDDSDDEEDDDDSDEDEDDEDDEPPKRKKKGKSAKKPRLRAGMKVQFEDDKGRTKKGVITSIDGDTIFVEDSKQDEWELSEGEIELV